MRPIGLVVLGLSLLGAACASSPAPANGIDMTLETDGAWVHSFATDPETAYHAAMRALLDDGYTVVRADPLGGSFNAKSKVEDVGWGLWYQIAHVVVEPGLDGGARVRVGLVKTRETKGGGREPNNDRSVTERADYEKISRAIEKLL